MGLRSLSPALYFTLSRSPPPLPPQVLQEDVVTLVNRVAAIVHGAVVNNFGAPNKNIGDAFLVRLPAPPPLLPLPFARPTHPLDPPCPSSTGAARRVDGKEPETETDRDGVTETETDRDRKELQSDRVRAVSLVCVLAAHRHPLPYTRLSPLAQVPCVL
jgi:hypothetical protein